MIDIFFILLFLFFPYFIFKFTKKYCINLLYPSLLSITVILYFIFSYIGILPLYFGLDSYRVRLGINNKNIILLMWLMSSLSIFVIIATYILFSKILNFDYKIDTKYKFKQLPKNLIYSDLFFLILYVISSIVLIYYISKIPKIPLFAAINGDSSMAVKQYRSAATNAFSGNSHYYNLFIDLGLNLSTFYFWIRYLSNKTPRFFGLFCLVLVTTIFSVIYTTQKAPIIWLLLGLYSILLILKNKRYNVKSLFAFALISIPFLFLFYSYFMNMKDRGVIEILSAIISRTFSGQLTPAYSYLELYPGSNGFLYGKSFPNPGGIFPFQRINLPIEVFNIKFSMFVSDDIVGSAPAPFWGESYVNFGWIGIIVFSVYIAIIFIITDIFFKLIKLDYLTLPFYIMFAIEYKNIALGGISNYLFNINLIFLVSLMFFVLIFRKRGKEKIESMPRYYGAQIK